MTIQHHKALRGAMVTPVVRDRPPGRLHTLEFSMLKRWLAFSFNGNQNGNGASSAGTLGTGLANLPAEPMELNQEGDRRSARPVSSAAAPPKPASFDQIYQSAAAKPPQIRYGILKVMEMIDSPHLAGMTPEAKRCALLMALDAARSGNRGSAPGCRCPPTGAQRLRGKAAGPAARVRSRYRGRQSRDSDGTGSRHQPVHGPHPGQRG